MTRSYDLSLRLPGFFPYFLYRPADYSVYANSMTQSTVLRKFTELRFPACRLGFTLYDIPTIPASCFSARLICFDWPLR
mgnify:CR=1 FL=1